MPEGDTIAYAAGRMRPVLVGRVPQVGTPHPRFGQDRWPERLAGRPVRRIDTHGKHLFLRFGGDEERSADLVIHSHLRMTGGWGTYRHDQRWRRAPHRAWLTLATEAGVVVQFDGPVLELITESRVRFDHRLTLLGPDILADELDEDGVLRRLRRDDPTRAIGDALLDQRTVAGIGNLWKCEGCFDAGVNPWRAAGEVSDDEVRDILRRTRLRMRQSATDGRQDRQRRIYGRAGRPCTRCETIVGQRGQGDGNRPTFWCAGCQS